MTCAAVATFAGIVSINPAVAAENPSSAAAQTIIVNGANLQGANTNSSFTATVTDVPAGTKEVTFILDGVFLGTDKTAPYTWNVSTAKGNHTLKARSETAATKLSTASDFTAGSSVTAPVIKPVPVIVTPAPAPVKPTPVPAGKTVSTSAQLVTALKTATAGSTIFVADGIYVGDFDATASGKAGSPISLVGTPKAVLTTGNVGSGYGLHITGDYWNVKGISVTNSAKGIVLDGSESTTLDNVDVGNIGEEAVHFRANSSNGKVINSNIHDTGKKKADYGEGVYIGTAKSNWKSIMGSSSTVDASNNTLVQNNRISNTTAEGIDAKEGTTGGKILDNTFTNSGYSGANYGDSWVDLKGNEYTVSGNVGSATKLDAFQVHQALKGWGNNNKFSKNTVTSDVPGYLVSVQSGVTGTTIACQVTNAKQGLSNITCT